MSEFEYRVVEASSLKMEEGAEELLNSPEMQPYGRYIEAAMSGNDVGPAMKEIADLPLEKRYVWRIASALKHGFSDFEDWNVWVDRKTLQQEDLDKLMKLLRLRPIQVCLFLKALVGTEEMERVSAVARRDFRKQRSLRPFSLAPRRAAGPEAAPVLPNVRGGSRQRHLRGRH